MGPDSTLRTERSCWGSKQRSYRIRFAYSNFGVENETGGKQGFRRENIREVITGVEQETTVAWLRVAAARTAWLQGLRHLCVCTYSQVRVSSKSFSGMLFIYWL